MSRTPSLRRREAREQARESSNGRHGSRHVSRHVSRRRAGGGGWAPPARACRVPGLMRGDGGSQVVGSMPVVAPIEQPGASSTQYSDLPLPSPNTHTHTHHRAPHRKKTPSPPVCDQHYVAAVEQHAPHLHPRRKQPAAVVAHIQHKPLRALRRAAGGQAGGELGERGEQRCRGRQGRAAAAERAEVGGRPARRHLFYV